MQIVRRTGAALAVLALALFAAGSAFAQSTDLYPASDVVSIGSAPMTVGYFTCTFHGGTVTLPAKGSTGAVNLSYSERPSLTGCGTNVTAVESGTWSLSIEYGNAQGQITIPPEGLKIESSKGEYYFFSTSAIKLNVAWNNGFSSPVSVGSAMEVWGSPEMWSFVDGKYHPTSFGPSLVSLTDTTHPASLPLLGP
jgi:hypothetical protein